jgi:hypothetical protein
MPVVVIPVIVMPVAVYTYNKVWRPAILPLTLKLPIYIIPAISGAPEYLLPGLDEPRYALPFFLRGRDPHYPIANPHYRPEQGAIGNYVV